MSRWSSVRQLFKTAYGHVRKYYGIIASVLLIMLLFFDRWEKTSGYLGIPSPSEVSYTIRRTIVGEEPTIVAFDSRVQSPSNRATLVAPQAAAPTSGPRCSESVLLSAIPVETGTPEPEGGKGDVTVELPPSVFVLADGDDAIGQAVIGPAPDDSRYLSLSFTVVNSSFDSLTLTGLELSTLELRAAETDQLSLLALWERRPVLPATGSLSLRLRSRIPALGQREQAVLADTRDPMLQVTLAKGDAAFVEIRVPFEESGEYSVGTHLSGFTGAGDEFAQPGPIFKFTWISFAHSTFATKKLELRHAAGCSTT